MTNYSREIIRKRWYCTHGRNAGTAISNSNYLSPRDIIQCLRLKVWDEDLEEMIGLGDLK